jgi:hypothetical protein
MPGFSKKTRHLTGVDTGGTKVANTDEEISEAVNRIKFQKIKNVFRFAPLKTLEIPDKIKTKQKV